MKQKVYLRNQVIFQLERDGRLASTGQPCQPNRTATKFFEFSTGFPSSLPRHVVYLFDHIRRENLQIFQRGTFQVDVSFICCLKCSSKLGDQYTLSDLESSKYY